MVLAAGLAGRHRRELRVSGAGPDRSSDGSSPRIGPPSFLGEGWVSMVDLRAERGDQCWVLASLRGCAGSILGALGSRGACWIAWKACWAAGWRGQDRPGEFSAWHRVLSGVTCPKSDHPAQDVGLTCSPRGNPRTSPALSAGFVGWKRAGPGDRNRPRVLTAMSTPLFPKGEARGAGRGRGWQMADGRGSGRGGAGQGRAPRGEFSE